MISFLNCSTGELNHSYIWSPHIVLALGIPQIIINLVSIIFNCSVIYTVSDFKYQNRPIFILFCNLAVSDLLVSLSGLWIAFQFITEPNSTIFGSWRILFTYVSYTISILSTIYNLVAIGIERYLTMFGKMRPNCRIYRKQILSTMGISWMVAIILGSLPLMGWNCLKRNGNVSSLYGPFCVDYLLFITIPNCVLAFAFPLITHIGIILKIRMKKVCIQTHAQPYSTYRAVEVQVAKTCVCIWTLALISYSPFFGGVLWDVINTICPEDLQTNIIVFRNLSAILVSLNSMGNPIIYTLKLKHFIKSFVFCKCHSSNQISAQTIVNI